MQDRPDDPLLREMRAFLAELEIEAQPAAQRPPSRQAQNTVMDVVLEQKHGRMQARLLA